MTITIATHYTQRIYNWTNWKAQHLSKKGIHQYDDDTKIYTIWFYDGPEAHICYIYKGIVPDGIISHGYSQEQNDEDKLDFETNYKTIANKRLDNKDAENRVLVCNSPRVGEEAIYATSNFCDKCTWYSNSTRINNETLTDSGDGYRFNSNHTFWIDVVSGRILNDDDLIQNQMIFDPQNPHGYLSEIKVDGYVKTARLPFTNSGGDYEIFYEDGYVKFFENQSGKTITASYSYAVDSAFVFKPLPNEILDIEAVEADFSSDVVMNDAIYYAVYGYVQVFAPQYAYKVASGYATFTNASTIVTGNNTNFTTEITPGMYVRLEDAPPQSYMVVASVDSDTQLTLAYPYAGNSGTLTMAYSANPTGVYPENTKIPLKTQKYKRYTQILQEAIGAYPSLPPNGASQEHLNLSVKEFRRQSRGSRSHHLAIPFRYATSRSLYSNYGMELRIGLENNIVFDGTSATLTFYCTTRKEE